MTAFSQIHMLPALLAAMLIGCILQASALPTEHVDKRMVNLDGMVSYAKTSAISPAPAGAYGTTYKLSRGTLFAWQSKRPHSDSDAEVVAITIHGVDRNADTYFTDLNSAYLAAKGKKPDAPTDRVIRVAPQFFAVYSDADALNSSTLAWSEDNDWSVGYKSLHPQDSNMSSFSVLDELIDHFANASQFPNMRKIIIVGHGGGGMLVSRYAALRNDYERAGITLRYVIGNPSAMLYFTSDRYKTISTADCDYYNKYFYGMQSYDAPYMLGGSNAQIFKTFAARDVRYLVSLDDTSTTNGDQSCGARAQGGAPRKTRSLTYWKYINLLAGASPSSLSQFPGQFPSLTNGGNPRASFRTPGNTINHQLFQLQGLGHDASTVLPSSQGQTAIFG